MAGNANKIGSFHINQIQNAPSSNSNNQIDEFIVQLMTSDKFNELADIIAEKAARKIKNYNNKNSTLRHSSKIEKRDRNKEKISVRETHPESMLRQRNVQAKSSKFGKINKAFLKHDGMSRELSLNYKHMTKELNNLAKKAEDEKEEAKKQKDEIFSDHSVEQSKPYSKEKTVSVESESSERKYIKAKSKPSEDITKQRSFVSEEKHLNSGDKHKSEDPTPSKTLVKKRKKNNFSSENFSRENLKEEHKTKKSFNKKPKTKNDDISSDSSHYEIKKNTENKNTEDPSKEIVEVGIKRAYDDTKSGDLSEHRAEVKLNFSSDESKPIQQKQIVRRENGKLYTYLSSPDYDEYHENVKNQRNIAKNKYINTY